MNFRRLVYQSVLWRGLYFVSVLGLNIVIARYYEASYSGLIYFITNSFALIVTIGGFSLESGMGYYVVSGKVKALPLANFSIGWTLAATIASLLMLFLLVDTNIISSAYANYSFAAFCYIAGCMLVNFFTAFFYAHKDFLSPNLVMTIVNIILIMLIPLSNEGLFNKEQYIDIYFGGFLFQGLVLALLFFMFNKAERIIQLPSKQSLKRVFKYAFQAFGANLLFFLLYRVDYFFVEKYCSAGNLGNYIQVSKLVQLFLVLPAIIASAVFPMSAAGDKETLHRGLAQLSRILVFGYCMICIVLSVVGYWLFPWVFGKSFDNMLIPFILLVPGIISLCVVSLLSAYFAGQDKVWINAVSSFCGLIMIVLGNVIWIPANGIVAASAVSSVGYFIVLVVLLFAWHKDKASLGIRQLFIIRPAADLGSIKAIWLKISNLLKKEP
ncbi:MAG: polysaccharide biosynthesis C-terminal domain-containing protein [Chitinophagaceae bacterium]|nr:polysaccharide biosynthesis C-terminal domain-containing protein [Chitinophagaceae bacterium]